MMTFEKARNSDYEGILALQKQNFISNLTPEEKKQGFLSIEFTQKQFETMNKEIGIVVCKDNGRVVGYRCASSLQFNRAFPLLAAMIELYPTLKYHHKTLNQYNIAITGPCCIEKNHRGKGIYSKLWQELYKVLPSDINLISTFMSVDNPHSLAAIQKTGMEIITIFEFNQKKFMVLAKNI